MLWRRRGFEGIIEGFWDCLRQFLQSSVLKYELDKMLSSRSQGSQDRADEIVGNLGNLSINTKERKPIKL